MLNRFDHVTFVVRDVAQATASYTALLGAAPTWRGADPDLGTRSALFGLSNGMIELVGPRDDAPEAEGMRLWLEQHGDGLQALAFGTPDADSCSATLRERGLRATPPQSGEPIAEDGTPRSYRSVLLSPRSARGLSLLAVERPDPQQLLAASGETAIDHVVIRSREPDAALALYRDGLGLRLALDRVIGQSRMLFFRVGGVTIEIVHDPKLTETDRLWGVAYRVTDLEAARQRLSAAGLTPSEPRAGAKPGTQVFSVPSGTCGVPTLFIRDPAREPSSPLG
jgi:catechol 2,3-dioxygenase-like lactoylglutathione lyase family enzyme